MFSLVLPTYNEAENLPELLPKIGAVLKDIPHEIIVVDDDSPDKTWKVAREISEKQESVHVIRRVGRRGLSSAVIEGFMAAKGNVLGVMDADGQHDMELLPKLYAAIKGGKGLAVGSRYIEGGGVGEWDERRHLLSRVATRMAQWLCKVHVNDPMSGFFAVKSTVINSILPQLNPMGFKILLDILVHAPRDLDVQEVPFTFSTRLHGESKLSKRVQLEFLEYLYDVVFGRYIPLVFVKYCVVGTLGVAVQLSAYYLFSSVIAQSLDQSIHFFSIAVLLSIEVTILFNFLLNNAWTFSHAKLHGWQLIPGFAKYNVACAFGALANVAVSTFLYSIGTSELLSLIVGAGTGVVWNYTMSRLLTWK